MSEMIIKTVKLRETRGGRGFRYHEDRVRGLPPTPSQLSALIYLERTGSIKAAAAIMKKSDKTIEYHLHECRLRAGLDSLYSLIGWGFRKGYLK